MIQTSTLCNLDI